MRITIFFALLLFTPRQLLSQEVTDEFVDSLYQRDGHYKLVAVRRINHALKYIKELDTIAYSRAGATLTYSYNGKVINDAFDRTDIDKPVSLFIHTRHGPYFRVTMYIVKVLGESRIEKTVVRAEQNAQYSKLVLEHYVNDIPDGKYLELTPCGETLVEGNFTQIDSSWQDTFQIIDPMSYETIYRLIVRDKYPVKTGRWLYRNEEGDTIEIEEFPKID